MKNLRFTINEARCYADKNSIYTNQGEDPPVDQRTIIQGYESVPQN